MNNKGIMFFPRASGVWTDLAATALAPAQYGWTLEKKKIMSHPTLITN